MKVHQQISGKFDFVFKKVKLHISKKNKKLELPFREGFFIMSYTIIQHWPRSINKKNKTTIIKILLKCDLYGLNRLYERS